MNFPKYNKCCYCHPQGKCLAHGKECYNCATLPCVDETEDPIAPLVTAELDYPDNQADCLRESRSRHSQPGRHSSCSQSQNPSPCHSSRSPRQHRRSTTSSTIKTVLKYFQYDPWLTAWRLPTSPKKAPSWQNMHQTDMSPSTPNWCSLQRMGWRPWVSRLTQVNTIPLSRYQKIFSHKINTAKYIKQGTLIPTKHSWISHDGKSQPFLGQFIASVKHASQPRLYPMWFYVFKDATSPHILLSYATSECLGILEFKVPNLVAQSHIDTITLPSSPWGRLPNVSHFRTP